MDDMIKCCFKGFCKVFFPELKSAFVLLVFSGLLPGNVV